MADVMFEVGVDMLYVMEIIVTDTPNITLGFVVGVAYSVDVLDVAITDVVTAIEVDMLTDENVNGSAAVMTPLELTLPSPWEKPMPFC